VDRRRCTVQGDFTGAHPLHLSAAGSVLDAACREAAARGIEVAGVHVRAGGGFDPDSWRSTGIEHTIEPASGADEGSPADLPEVVDRVAEIPRSPRSGTSVRRMR
jgi:hypothetical protein